ncbi:MAG: prephenate dehydratase [Bacteroidales bacterium]|nr:prephenate dehydratase [Bacteroidales bacterium]
MEQKRSQKPIVQIAIQGGEASFHEIASRKYFNNGITIQPCDTFEAIIDSLVFETSVYGCFAIENTVAGSILQNYTLIKENPVEIVGEVYLRITQNLLALSGQRIEDIREVHSHHMAIAQCRLFFKDFPWIKLVESVDTAISAREISEGGITGRGAIASHLAAETFHLDVLAEGIETNKRNFTRFLILAKKGTQIKRSQEPDKASLCFSLLHQTGSLAKILSVIAFYDINLTKIQSLPILGREWQYFFYVDVAFTDYNRYRQCLSAIEPLVDDMHILGEYTHGADTFETIHQKQSI